MSDAVRTEIEIEAGPEEVWEALSDPARWLGDHVDAPDGLECGADFAVDDRCGRVEAADPAGRLVWWWWRADEAPTRVEVLVVAAPASTRVVVVERRPEAVWDARLRALACAAGALALA